MTTRDETHEDFAWPSAEEAEAENAAQAPDARRGTAEPGRHTYTPSANPRQHDCVRCGKPKEAHPRMPLHDHPELVKASVVCHAEAGIARLREGDHRSAELEFEIALRVLRGER